MKIRDNPNRWCEHHEYEHGPLYVCEFYSDELKRELGEQAERFRANLADPEWCAAQDCPPEVIAIMKVFMGVEE
jgi:hypothetical protein